MGMDLVGDSGAKLRVSTSGWAYFLNLAELYGWRPEGGSYEANNGRHVSKRDAAGLARALEDALLDPERAVRGAAPAERLTQQIRRAAGIPEARIELEPDESAFLRELVSFLWDGGFAIH